MLNLFYYDFGARLIKPDPNIYYRTAKERTNFGPLFLFLRDYQLSIRSNSSI